MTANYPTRLGILMLDTRFPRILGDVGCAETWPFPVRYGVVAGASPHAVVCADQSPWTQAFIAKGQELVAEGCAGIATTCGFLAPMRRQLAEALGVPVAASALEQSASVQAMLPGNQKLGVLTISAASLTQTHLEAADVPKRTVIRGMDDTCFAKTILGNGTSLDVELAEIEMRDAACSLVDDHPDVGALLLECTNMPPYAETLARATGRPVYSIYTYLLWFHAGLSPQLFPD